MLTLHYIQSCRTQALYYTCTPHLSPWFLYNPYILIPRIFCLLVSPSFFYLLPACFYRPIVLLHTNVIFGTSIVFVPALLNSSLDKLTHYVGSTGCMSQLVSSMSSSESSRCSTYSNIGDWFGKH